MLLKVWISFGFVGEPTNEVLFEFLEQIKHNKEFDCQIESTSPENLLSYLRRPIDIILCTNEHSAEIIETINAQNNIKPLIIFTQNTESELNKTTSKNNNHFYFNYTYQGVESFIKLALDLEKTNRSKIQAQTKEEELSESLAQQIADAVNVEVFMVNTEMRLKLFNNIWASEFEKYFGIWPQKGMAMADPKTQPAEAYHFWKNLFKTALEGQTHLEEITINGRNGLRKVISIKVSPYKNHLNHVVGAFCVAENISEKVEIATQLQWREKKLEIATNLAKIYPWELDVAKNLIELNENFAEFLEIEDFGGFLTPEQLANYFHPDDKEWVQNGLIETVKTGVPLKQKHRFLIHNKTKWMSVAAEAIKNERAEIIKVIGVARDITERIEHEQKILENEEIALEQGKRLDFALEGAGAAMWDIDFEHNAVVVDDRWPQMLGYKRDELKPINLETFQHRVHPDDIAHTFTAFDNYISGNLDKYSIIFRLQQKNNNYIWVWAQAIAVKRDANGRVLRMIGTNQNIDKLRKGEINLRKSEQKFRSLVENATDIFYILSCNKEMTYISKQVENILGYRVAELEGKQFWKCVHHEDLAQIEGVIDKTFIEKISVQLNNFRLKHKNGSIHWFNSKSTNILDTDGNIIEIQGVLSNIDITKDREELLQRSISRSENELDISQRLNYVLTESELFDCISYGMRKMLGENTIFAFSRQKIGKKFTILNLDGDFGVLNKALDLVRIPLENSTIELENNFLQNLAKGEIIITKDSINSLVEGQLSKILKIFKYSLFKSHTLYTCPLIVNGQVLGIISIFTKYNPLEMDLMQIQSFGNQISNAWSRLFYYKDLATKKEQLEDAQHIAKLGSWEFDIEKKETIWSRESFKILEFPVADNAPQFAEYSKYIEPMQHDAFLNTLKKTFTKGHSFDVKLKLNIHQKQKWLRTRGNAIKDHNDNIIKLQGIVQDITNEEELRQNLEQNKSLLEIAQDIGEMGSWSIDFKTSTLLWSEKTYAIFEQDLQKSTSLELFNSLVYPEDKPVLEMKMHEAFETGQYNVQYRIMVPTGIKWIHAKARLFYNQNNEAEKVIGAIQDITEFVSKEAELKRINDRYKFATNVAEDIIFEYNVLSDNFLWNTKAFDHFEEKTPKTFSDFCELVVDHCLNNFIKQFDEICQNGGVIKKMQLQFELSTYNKPFVIANIISIPNKNNGFTVYGSFSDITAHILNTNAQQLIIDINNSTNQPSDLIQKVTAICEHLQTSTQSDLCEIWMPNVDNSLLNRLAFCSAKEYYNDLANAHYGEGVVQSKTGIEFLTWQNKQHYYFNQEQIAQANNINRSKACMQMGINHLIAHPLIKNNKIVAIFLLFFNDPKNGLNYTIDLLNHIELPLSTEFDRLISRRELNKFQKLSPDFLIIADFNGNFKKANEHFASVLEYSYEELLKMKFEKLLHPDDIQTTRDAIAKAITAPEKTHYLENRYYAKSGKVVWLSWTFNVSNEEQIFFGIAKDQTQKMQHLQLIESQNARLQDIAWTQSHIVRAPLANIMGLVKLFDMVKDDQETLNQVLNNIKTTAEVFDSVIKDITQKSEALYDELNANEESAKTLSSKPSIVQ